MHSNKHLRIWNAVLLTVLMTVALVPAAAGDTCHPQETATTETEASMTPESTAGSDGESASLSVTGITTELTIRQPGAHFVEDLGGGVLLELVWIPPGEFMMGSADGHKDEIPVHKVRITRGFYMGKYEVTQPQWEMIIGFNPSTFPRPSRPVERVSWFDCQEFVRKLSEKTGHTFRLPTEAEWEYACRAGTTSRYYFGDDPDLLDLYAWYIGNSGLRSQPAGVKNPNAWGLCDMLGNAWEWCQDWYGKKYYETSPAEDPQGPETGHDRIIRGGGWLVKKFECRSANRARFNPVNGINYNTCRVVMVTEEPAGDVKPDNGTKDITPAE